MLQLLLEWLWGLWTFSAPTCAFSHRPENMALEPQKYVIISLPWAESTSEQTGLLKEQQNSSMVVWEIVGASTFRLKDVHTDVQGEMNSSLMLCDCAGGDCRLIIGTLRRLPFISLKFRSALIQNELYSRQLCQSAMTCCADVARTQLMAWHN